MSLDSLLQVLPQSYTPADHDLIRRAYDVALAAHNGQSRASGESYIVHPLAVAGIFGGFSRAPAPRAGGRGDAGGVD